MGCSHDCSSCSSDCKSKNSESLRESLNQYSSVKKVIAVVSGKGGVGKSLVTSTLAVTFNRLGKKRLFLTQILQVRQFQRLLALTKEQRATNTELFLLQPKRELILCQ